MKAVKYLYRVGAHWSDDIYIEARTRGFVDVVWAITKCSSSEVFARDGKWEWEMNPSARDEDFLARTRYNSLSEAVDTLNAFGIESNG